MKLNHFKDIPFLPAIKALFNELKVPMNYVADEPTTAEEILKDTYKENETFQLVDDVYFVGMIDDAAFEGNQSLDTRQIKSDYDGILVFGITLHQRQNNLLPTRSQLAEISRAFNREFYYTPVVLVFKYQNEDANYIAFANTERLKYKQAWREGEKAGKVSLLRDINIEKPHRGHEDIINQLRIPTSGTKAVDSFAKLYTYWQEVFSVSVLNKKFYQELSNWYFWAVKHVTFPNKPTTETVVEKYGKFDQQKLDELIQEHNATNVIRLLTRLLFTWFIKEKKLIPEDLFDLDALQKDILNEISPYHEEGTMFAQANKDSVYYKAILQNLFFASLNCPIEADGIDNRTRGFRGDGYGTHRGVDYLMRYKKYFKDPDAFLGMLNKTVPFLNGGLFECLDDKYQNLYIDGFSDQMTKGEQLIVPDYLFFGTSEEVDLSAEYGVKNKGTKQAAVKGLINILKSYKFTITENTPIEEDVALDPELLGKVFENLLASYNPETKTTARKQTGSFYTPREIVNYMVDESLIAYLKNAVSNWNMDEKELDEKLHQLTSFDPINPFDQNTDLSKRIVKVLDECTILDPACGSGAFPMGILQKMVHMLQKLDPQNEFWKEVQLDKAISATEEAYGIEDKKEREEKLIEINNAFDENVNDPDYARKLYLIENCIYGVDIQAIATQIAKLRFFISLVVDQKATDDSKDNFNIRPLPNLETKFVTANTLIGIEKPKAQTSLFDTPRIKELETELKKVRHKLFSARTKDTKLKYRQKDEELRNGIAHELKQSGWPNDTAEKLKNWDPYDQNYQSQFFDKEWMFDLKDGFDIIIGNPPYLGQSGNKETFRIVKNSPLGRLFHQRRMDYFYFFFHAGIELLKEHGTLSFITTNYFFNATYADKLRAHINKECQLVNLVDFNEVKVFESAQGQHNAITTLLKTSKITSSRYIYCERKEIRTTKELEHVLIKEDSSSLYAELSSDEIFNGIEHIDLKSKFNINQLDTPLSILEKSNCRISDFFTINQGVVTGGNKVSNRHLKTFRISANAGEGIFILTSDEVAQLDLNSVEQQYIKPWYKNSNVHQYTTDKSTDQFLIYYTSLNTNDFERIPNLVKHFSRFKELLINRNVRTGQVSISDYEDFVLGKSNIDYVMIKSTFQSGNYFAVSYARDQDIFERPKIVCPQRSYRNTFAYNDIPWYGASDLYYINSKSDSIVDLKVLLIILNSQLIYKWLYNKGQRKGEMLQLFKDPLSNIPLIDLDSLKCKKQLSLLSDAMILSNSSQKLKTLVDSFILELYFPEHMKERQINVLEFMERDINQVLQGQEFESLSESEKEKVINQLHVTWSHPDNEVRNRMKLFAVRSPEILKPILEG